MKNISPKIEFSIIIPTLNESGYLPLLLKDLTAQTFPKNLFEVVVVDGNSKDNTVKQALSFTDHLQITVINSKKAHVSVQRNLGVTNSKAKWVIFMDADNRIPPEFLDGVKYQLATHQKTDCFTCWIDETNYKTVDKPLITMLNLLIEVFSKIKPGAPGSLIGTKRSLATKHPFNTKLAMSEDHEFISSLVKSNHRFYIFHFPKYQISLRRLESEGTLKLARTYAKAQLFLLMGRQIKNGEIDYPMGGDVHASRSAWHQTNIRLLRNNITELINNHKQTAQKILKWLNQNQI